MCRRNMSILLTKRTAIWSNKFSNLDDDVAHVVLEEKPVTAGAFESAIRRPKRSRTNLLPVIGGSALKEHRCAVLGGDGGGRLLAEPARHSRQPKDGPPTPTSRWKAADGR